MIKILKCCKNLILPGILLLVLIVLVQVLDAQSAPSLADASPGKSAYPTGGVAKFFYAGRWLVWVVLLPLSLITISLAVQFFMLLRRSKILPDKVLSRTKMNLAGGNVLSAATFLVAEGSFLSRALYAGLSQIAQTDSADRASQAERFIQNKVAMELAVNETLEQEATSLLRRIEWLNIIGNVAPMVGLFGTVWGMIDAFDGIVRAGGQPELSDLAGGISTALVTTWWGMVVAIPALASYGVLRNRIDSFVAEAAVVADEIFAILQKNNDADSAQKDGHRTSTRPAHTSRNQKEKS